MANKKILEVENLLQSLSDEMLKLKSATKNYEETKENLQKMCESIDKISMTHQKLTNNMSQFLAEIEKMNYREQTDKILQQGENQSKALSDEFRKQTDKILQHNESQSKALSDEFREQTDRILQNNESQSRALGDLITKQTDKILQNDESQSSALSDLLTKQTDRILQHNENQSKALRLVKYLALLGVLMEVVVIIRMLLF